MWVDKSAGLGSHFIYMTVIAFIFSTEVYVKVSLWLKLEFENSEI